MWAYVLHCLDQIFRTTLVDLNAGIRMLFGNRRNDASKVDDDIPILTGLSDTARIGNVTIHNVSRPTVRSELFTIFFRIPGKQTSVIKPIQGFELPQDFQPDRASCTCDQDLFRVQLSVMGPAAWGRLAG